MTKRRRPALRSRPGAGQACCYLLIELPKLKTSISSSMKRTSTSSMALLRGLGWYGVQATAPANNRHAGYREMLALLKEGRVTRIRSPGRCLMSKRRTVIGFVVSAAYLAGAGYLCWLGQAKFSEMKPNEFGDLLAGIAGPLALFWLIIGYLQQGEEPTFQDSPCGADVRLQPYRSGVRQAHDGPHGRGR